MSTPKPFWTVQVNLKEDEYLKEVFYKSFVFASSSSRRYLSSFHNRLYQVKSYQIQLAPTLQIQYTQNSKKICPEMKLRDLSPNSTIQCIHVSVNDSYIPTIGLPIVLQENRWTDRENI